LNSQGTCENADVAIAASAAAATNVLDKGVIESSSELTWTPTDRALTNQRLNFRGLEMPLHNRFDSPEASTWIARIALRYRFKSQPAFPQAGNLDDGWPDSRPDHLEAR
jgi:hypothetical protein